MGLSRLKDKTTLTNVVTGLLLFILFIPNIATLLYSEDLAGFVVKQAGYLAVSLILLLLPAVFLKKKVYFIVEGILSLTFAPIEIASLYLSRTTTHYPEHQLGGGDGASALGAFRRRGGRRGVGRLLLAAFQVHPEREVLPAEGPEGVRRRDTDHLACGLRLFLPVNPLDKHQRKDHLPG